MYKYLIVLCVVYRLTAMDIIYTDNQVHYKFFPASNSSIHFKVKAANDVHVALTSGPQETDPMVEVVIGGWGNTNSAIRRRFKTIPEKVTAETPGILSGSEHRGFWVSWDDGVIKVGRESVDTPFMSWTDPNPFHVASIGVHTGFGATGYWVFEEQEDLNKVPSSATVASRPPSSVPKAVADCQDCKCCMCCRCDNSEQRFIPRVSYKDLNTDGNPEYNFFPATNTSVHFKVKASSDVNIALTTGSSKDDPIIEVFIGAWNNTISLIRQNRTKPDKAEVDTPGVVNGDEFRGFWVRWDGGAISAGLEGTDAPFISWEDPDPLPIAFFGVRTGWGANGTWLIEGHAFVRLQTRNSDVGATATATGYLCNGGTVHGAHTAHAATTVWDIAIRNCQYV